MQALVIDRHSTRLDRSLIALIEAGFQATGTASLEVAEICLARLPVDVLIIDKSTVGDALGDTLGFAEEQNIRLTSVLRTPDVAQDMEELPQFFPSLHSVLGDDVTPDLALKMAMASLAQGIAPVAALKKSLEPIDDIETEVLEPWRSRFREAQRQNFAVAS